MTHSGAAPLHIEPAASQQHRRALELLLRRLDPEHRQREVARLLELAAEGKTSLSGLLLACRGEQWLGVVWVQLQPGRTAVLWTPQIVEEGSAVDADDETTRRLTCAAIAFAEASPVRLVQAALPERDSPEARWFEAAGLRHLAELDYLVAPVASAAPVAPREGGLITVRYQATADRQRLERILARTYEDSQDCPTLGGVRDPRDVVEGYAAVGPSATEHWHFLQCDDTDVGCLLLADHPQSEEYELVYVGLEPRFRGRGLGRLAARHAQWLARVGGGKRMVLAVDSTNAPAQAAYAAAGFVRYDRRSVWVKVFA